MQVILKNVRLAFGSIFEPREQINGGLKYEANLLFNDKANIAELEKAIKAVAADKWKDKGLAIYTNLEKGRKCFRNGDQNVNASGEVYQGYAGNKYVVAKSKVRPKVVDGQKRDLVAADGKPYNGCYVNAIIDVYAVAGQKAGGNGVFAELKVVQFYKDGDAFGGSSTPASLDGLDTFDTDTIGDFADDTDGLA